MYCPNCGQQQISEEMRFCSRCGLALTGLAEWLAGGTLPARRPEQAQVALTSPRRKNVRRAAKLMFFSGVLLPVFFVFCMAINEGAPMFLPVFIFFVSIVWMLYARLFIDDTPRMINQAAHPARGSLPPATTTSTPVAGRQQVRTNELAQPPSVTEHTTRFLNNE